MMYLIPNRAVAAAILVSFCASAAIAQSFDDGSFDPGGATQTQPVTGSSGGAGGGFDDGSFEPGGGGTPGVAPPQTGGGTVTGDDFPPANVLPDVPGGGGVAPAPAPTPTPTPTPQPGGGGGADPQVTAFETRDFGVAAQNSLRQGEFHAPTPTALPGGYLVTTENLARAMNDGTPMVVIDVLGSGYGLPNAYNANELASPGSFNDRTQQRATAWLQQITGGKRDLPIVIYCSDPMCWLSYNASLRTVAAGYSQVYWYRGGVRAWQMVGLPLQPSGF